MARMDMSTIESAELAAQAGGIDTLFELGMMYASGRDVEMDLVNSKSLTPVKFEQLHICLFFVVSEF